MRAKLGGFLSKVARPPSPAMLVALLALVIAASGAAFAAIPSPSGTITACYDKGNATLRVIDTLEGEECHSTETQLRWKDGIHGKVADSDKLDGKDSSWFARASLFGNAVNAPRSGESFDREQCALGEVGLFAGDQIPRGWKVAHGQLLPIDKNTGLFALLGNKYGGNGPPNGDFALPDLRGAEPNGAGKAAPNYAICTQGYFPG